MTFGQSSSCFLIMLASENISITSASEHKPGQLFNYCDTLCRGYSLLIPLPLGCSVDRVIWFSALMWRSLAETIKCLILLNLSLNGVVMTRISSPNSKNL